MTTSIVLGLGGCLDSELVLDENRLQAMADDHAVSLSEVRQPAEIATERDLLISVLAFMHEGIGGERYVSGIEALLAVQDRFEHVMTVGGTNVRAGRTLALLGHPNVLHVPGRDETFESQLAEGSAVLPGTPRANYVPHLIVQYPQHMRVRLMGGSIHTSHANRVILVNDPVSELTPLHDGLADWLRPGGVFVISGLNSIRNEQILEDRLRALRGILEQAPVGLRVMYEDADYHVPAFRRRVWAEITPRASVVGMNEDELASFTGRPVDVTDPSQIASALETILANLPGGTVMVHSKYWALAAGTHARELGGALECGILAAGARYLEGDAARAESLDTAGEHPTSRVGEAVAEKLPARIAAPVTVQPARELRTGAPTTIGLGDTFLGGFIAGVVETGAMLETRSTLETT
ncbi:ADP-dependent glucokinase/phosphofructokinase [Brachybacterium sp. GCM10030268]|uniref:ADP-dependent glucokinase/phosphofructokinase n=1 Tax=Brachybacterium sp. GCM10030268 TaxID=3273382 RepID=UPI003624565F